VIDFDDADFSVGYDAESHPDEVVLPAATSHHLNGSRPVKNGPQNAARSSNAPIANGNGQPNSRPQSMPAPPRPQQVHDVTAAKTMQQAPQPQQQPQLQQPQTPTSANGYSRAISTGNQRMHQQQNGNQARPGQPGPPGQPGLVRPLYQPNRTDNPANRTGPPSAPTSPRQAQAPKLMSSNEVEPTASFSPSETVPASVGFYSAKALPKTTADPDAPLPVPAVNTLAAFNPKAESPSIRKTEGVDHNSSKPVNRSLKNVPGGTQQAAAAGAASANRTNIINPHLDATRRIGAPGSLSPLSNRGQYKPPTMKRPIDTSNMSARPPLEDMPINGTVVNGECDFKRQRLN
jgi:DNA repair and recombination protein RAD52